MYIRLLVTEVAELLDILKFILISMMEHLRDVSIAASDLCSSLIIDIDRRRVLILV